MMKRPPTLLPHHGLFDHSREAACEGGGEQRWVATAGEVTVVVPGDEEDDTDEETSGASDAAARQSIQIKQAS